MCYFYFDIHGNRFLRRNISKKKLSMPHLTKSHPGYVHVLHFGKSLIKLRTMKKKMSSPPHHTPVLCPNMCNQRAASRSNLSICQTALSPFVCGMSPFGCTSCLLCGTATFPLPTSLSKGLTVCPGKLTLPQLPCQPVSQDENYQVSINRLALKSPFIHGPSHPGHVWLC